MTRQAKRSSQRGLLLVEAVLSAIVIAVGLVFISRGLGSQLRAIHTVEEYETLLSLAHGKLAEFETQRLVQPTQPMSVEGTFDEPYQAYRWTLSATPRDGDTEWKDTVGTPLTSDVTLTVEQTGDASTTQPGRQAPPMVRLRAVWPSDWIR